MSTNETPPQIGNRTVAPLTNVSLCMELLELALNRDPRLPGIVCLYGFSGHGKSTAATYAYNKKNAYYIECRDTMTKKSFLLELLKEMGVAKVPNTVDEMFLAAVETLEDNPLRPLIVDQMDYLVAKEALNVVRDLQDRSRSVVLIIGEEGLPGKIKRYENFAGRVLKWEPSMPATLADVQHLARLYCPNASVEAPVLAKLHQMANGSARRASVNLTNISEDAKKRGLTTVTLADIAGLILHTGAIPKPRQGE